MSFGDVRGHEATLTLLKERLGRQCLPHALLFYGPRGVGKQKVAWALAKALVCEKYPQSVCGCCPSCKKAQMKSHPDISRLEPEGKSRIIKIEHIREMKSRVVLKPLEGKSQVVILEEAHKMNPEAQNAFLKVLEEPPQNVYFVLLSPDPQALLPTVRSRCQKFKFDPLNLEDQVAILTEDCGVGLEEASELATISEGSMEKALQMREADFHKTVEALFEWVLSFDSGSVSPLPEWDQDRETLFLMLDLLMQMFRDALVLKVTGSQEPLFFPNRKSEIQDLARRYETEEIEEVFEALIRARQDIENSINTKLVMDNIAIQLGMRVA